MRVLLTGATGFIGSHMAELLLNEGAEVVCPVRDPAVLRNLQGIPVSIVAIENLRDAITSNPHFDYVMHLGGATRARDYEGYRRANVTFTRELLETFSAGPCRERLKRFVLVSSQAASGPSPNGGTPVKEGDPFRPVSLYGRSKAEAEQVAGRFHEAIPITIIRPPAVFGPRDTDVLGVFRSVKFRVAPCLTGPERRVSIIYVSDLIEGILAAARAPGAVGQTYFLANPEPVVWRQFTLDIARVMGYRAVAVPVPPAAMKLVAQVGDVVGRLTGSISLFRSEKFEEMRQLAWICSAEKAYRDFGWQARFPLEEALGITARWYTDHGWL
jgi:nucleoside-diphosphate-sugar epimerase